MSRSVVMDWPRGTTGAVVVEVVVEVEHQRAAVEAEGAPWFDAYDIADEAVTTAAEAAAEAIAEGRPNGAELVELRAALVSAAAAAVGWVLAIDAEVIEP